MNVFNFTGNLGGDAEVRHTPNGKAICSFSVAVASGYGENKKTTWARCALFGKRAEGNLPQHLVKGQQVAISGELTLDEWQDKQGVTQKALKVVVNTLDLIGQKPAQQSHESTPPPQQAQGFDDFSDEVPF